MADYTAYRIPLLDENYPSKYDAFVTELQARAQEQENAREGQATLLANVQRRIRADVGLTQGLAANGNRITGLLTPVAADEPATKSFAESLAFSSALPNVNSTTKHLGITNNGATSKWGHSAAEAAATLGSWFNFF